MSFYTDIAAELYPAACKTVPDGVRARTMHAGGITLTRVEIERSGLRRPRGTYITMDMPDFARIDVRDEACICTAARQLRSLLPREGTVLVAGIGSRAVTADSLGPETAARIFATRHLGTPALRGVCAFAPGVEGATGCSAAELVRSAVQSTNAAAVIAVDSLCTGDARRLGCSVQLSTAGLCPEHTAPLTQEALGVPVIAAGIPTLMDACTRDGQNRNLIVTVRDIDSVIRRGSAFLAVVIGKALHPSFSVAELSCLCF